MDSMTLDPTRWFKAVAAGDLLTLRTMIVQGIDLELRDDQGRTALNIASQHALTEVMTTLLAARRMRYLQALDCSFTAPLPRTAGDSSSSPLVRTA